MTASTNLRSVLWLLGKPALLAFKAVYQYTSAYHINFTAVTMF